MSRTRQAANEPVELFFGDVRPGEVECDGLSLYDACEGLRGHSALDAQVNSGPEPFI